MGQAGRAVEYSCHAGDGGEAVCPESFAVGVTTPLTCCCQGRLAVMEAPRQPRWRGRPPERLSAFGWGSPFPRACQVLRVAVSTSGSA